MLSYHCIVCSLMDLAVERLNEMFSWSSYKCDSGTDPTLTDILIVSLHVRRLMMCRILDLYAKMPSH